MRPLPLAFALLAVCATPALAFDNTATVRGNPLVYNQPGDSFPATGWLPDGATVTLEQCTPENGAAFPGYPRTRQYDGDWCLVRGAGWVDASFLIGMRAKVNVTDPSSLVDTPSGLVDSPLLDMFGDEP